MRTHAPPRPGPGAPASRPWGTKGGRKDLEWASGSWSPRTPVMLPASDSDERAEEVIMDQRFIDLYDEYTHAPLERRVFLTRLARLAGGVPAGAAPVAPPG